MNRYWKLKAKNDDGAVDVYIVTSAEVIDQDLKAGDGSSLILSVRAQDEDGGDDANHRDLVKALFNQHMKRPGYRGAKAFEEVPALPEGKPAHEFVYSGFTVYEF